MTSYVTPKKGAEYIFYIGLVSQSTGQFQSNPTLAAGDFKVSIDGGALNNLATLPAVTPASSKSVKVTLSTSEMNGDNIIVIGSDAAGAEWDDVLINIQTSARQIDDLAYPTVSGRSLDISVSGNAGIDWSNVEGAGATQNLSSTTVGFIGTDGVSAASLTTSAISEISNGVLDASLAGHSTAGTAGGGLSKANSLTFSLAGNVDANLQSIDEQATNGWNATLYLKCLNIRNTDDIALKAVSTTNDAVYFQSTANNFAGFVAEGGSFGFEALSGGLGAFDNAAIYAYASNDAHAAQLITTGAGKSIDAQQDIALPSGDLDDQLQTIDNLIDTEVAAIKAKTDQLTFTTANQVDANIQSVNDTALTGDGSTTPWGPA